MEDLSLVINSPEEGQFLKEIVWNKEEFTKLATEVAERYEGSVYSDEQIKLAKEDRAKLNKLKKAISDRRIQVKKEVMAPYEKFEKEVAEVVKLIEAPISQIDAQVKAYEEKQKEEKKKLIVEYFSEAAKELEGIVTFDMVYEPSFLNVSASLASVKKKIDEKINKINSDLELLDKYEEEFRISAKNIYLRTMDLSAAMQEIQRLKEIKRREEMKRQAEEQRARELAEQKAREEEQARIQEEENGPRIEETEQKVPNQEKESEVSSDEAKDPFTKHDEINQQAVDKAVDNLETSKPQKKYKASFTVVGTMEQIQGLKQYMIDNNIQFGKVEK